MRNQNQNFYPTSYRGRPFLPIPPGNNFPGRRPTIPLFYNPVYQQTKADYHLKNEINSNPSTFKFYDLDTNNENEVIRLIFSYIGISYKDKRLKQDEWIKIKDKMPFEQLPILNINHKLKIFHLYAIIRYIAREFHLYGNNKHEQILIDIILETTRQLREKISGKFLIDNIIIYLKQLENFYDLFKCQGPFYLGSNISLADLIVYDTINYLIKIDPKLLDNYKHLKETRRILEKHPKIQNYLNMKTNKSKSPVEDLNSDKDQYQSTYHHHHHHHHHCRHHRQHSKEPTPVPQTRKRSTRLSKSPSIQTTDQDITSLHTNIIIPPPPLLPAELKN